MTSDLSVIQRVVPARQYLARLRVFIKRRLAGEHLIAALNFCDARDVEAFELEKMFTLFARHKAVDVARPPEHAVCTAQIGPGSDESLELLPLRCSQNSLGGGA